MNTIAAEKKIENRPRLRRHLFGVLLLFIVIYYMVDSATDDNVADISSLLQMREQDYDYFMADVDSMHYTASGQADYRFQADRVTHYPNPEYSLVDNPRLVILREDNSAWRINAVNARVEMDVELNQERLVLNENVIINGITADGSPIRITTESLTIYPESKSMHSDSDVFVEAQGFASSSRGFTADLNSNVIRQLADGQMQYDN